MRIGLKIGGIMAGIVILTAALQLWFFLTHNNETLSKALKDKALPLAELAAHDLYEPLEYDDRKGMQKVLSGFIKDPDTSFVALYGDDGELLSEAGAVEGEVPKPRDVEEPSPKFVGSILRVDVPISTSSGFNGTLVAGFSTRSLDKERQAILWRSLLVAFGIALVGIAAGLGFGTSLGRRLGRIAGESERIAEGDLSRPSLHEDHKDEIGRMARAFDRMVKSQRELVKQTHATVLQLNSSGGQFLATAQQSERGATEQSSAVEETNRTLTSLLGSARDIAQAAQGVTRNAERTQDNTRSMAERIGELSRQVERITEILELIKGIASKSEILALNAALEGTKAGEAGRGFSLVASQMQRLAENVMEAVSDIRNLTDSIREASQSSVMATEESTKLSSDTTRSARQIELIIEQQQTATEQVATAMGDVAQVATQTASASKEIVSSTHDILALTERLQGLVGRFNVDSGESGASARDGE